ncbi:flagellar biosynthesis anti-sigma factor FlgM [Planctomicrobium piriforme]|uniref:Anti-sigma-28 factor, FlgM n=1 Tax=Planctomicrobium piriforme TaxID=1576369 RepID=A0A1I3KZE8_9PLAN|nr:flagellar biosynthesis anti-sigma factor FlgM [Planctomicrobium piriforme]SFI77901.1 Anti-sigma-28 factor, FlgM [Planctomicrobium piriforme]
MRPEYYRNRLSMNFGTLNPGLFLFGSVVYNHRQNPPMMDGPVQGGSGDSLPPEAVMKPPRNTPKPSSSGALEPQSGSAAEAQVQPETRQQRLERIRREIQAGTYETPEKLEAAIERMLGVLVD